MENFFIDDKFFTDLTDFMEERDIDENELHLLDGDWSETAEHTELQKIFKLDEKFILEHLMEATDTFEGRFPDDCDSVDKKIKQAIMSGIDIDKINSNLPELYYPSGEKFKITKQDLIDYCA
jgi:hypothetical protein